MPYPVFAGSGDAGELDHVLHRFMDNAQKLSPWNTSHENFEHYPKMIKDDALEFCTWVVHVVPKYPNMTEDYFKDAMKDLRVSFGGGAYAKDNILNYLEGAEVRKPKDVTVQQHVRRIQHMITVANKSAGKN